MSALELKSKLIDRIQTTEDERILEEVFRLLGIESENIEVYKLNEQQTQAIREAREQIKNGQFMSTEEADKEIDEWLNK
ncbi:MAG: hypothetical protein KF763_08885 [Cyclobacteriaceae bacterium]|nr:hypothetical protein [Cyclobacteriaceae bacterium]HCZ36486.1 hypothetical protein [Cytophagales bacterium]HRG10225.1 hypothetical protein [Cyclobacteriaceae bacterium]